METDLSLNYIPWRPWTGSQKIETIPLEAGHDTATKRKAQSQLTRKKNREGGQARGDKQLSVHTPQWAPKHQSVCAKESKYGVRLAERQE
jgi:hypothetical protein